MSSYIGPGNPAILSVPVSTQDSPDFVLNLIEQGWNDLRIPGTVVPWQLFPIDSTRAQSGHRALAYPSYVMVSHDDFASFEQRPHGLMEVVVPGDSSTNQRKVTKFLLLETSITLIACAQHYGTDCFKALSAAMSTLHLSLLLILMVPRCLPGALLLMHLLDLLSSTPTCLPCIRTPPKVTKS